MFTFSHLSKTAPKLVGQGVPAKARLRLEELEQRDVPATITYTEGAVIGGQPYQHDGTGVWQNDPNRNDSQFSGGNLTEYYRVGRARHSPVGQPGLNGSLRSVVGFPLIDIPAGARIVSVSLRLNVESYGDAASPAPAVELHEYSGSALNEASATWNNTGGGAFLPGLLSSAPGVTSGPMEFGSNGSFVAAAQRALGNSQPLRMVLVSPSAEAHTESTNPQYLFRFYSDDAASAGLRPQLTVEYELADIAMQSAQLLPGNTVRFTYQTTGNPGPFVVGLYASTDATWFVRCGALPVASPACCDGGLRPART